MKVQIFEILSLVQVWNHKYREVWNVLQEYFTRYDLL